MNEKTTTFVCNTFILDKSSAASAGNPLSGSGALMWPYV